MNVGTSTSGCWWCSIPDGMCWRPRTARGCPSVLVNSAGRATGFGSDEPDHAHRAAFFSTLQWTLRRNVQGNEGTQYGNSGLQRGKCGWQQGIVVLLGLVCMASSAEAQSINTPALEIAVGYQNLHGEWGRSLHGLVVSAGRPVNDRLSLVGEVGIARLRYSDVYFVEEGQLLTYVGGVRFGSRRPRVAWFVHAWSARYRLTISSSTVFLQTNPSFSLGRRSPNVLG